MDISKLQRSEMYEAIRELAIMLIASKHNNGYEVRDLVDRIVEISGISLRKTVSRAITPLYTHDYMIAEYYDTKSSSKTPQIKKLTIRSQKYRDSIVTDNQKYLLNDVLNVGTGKDVNISVSQLADETGITYKDALRYASGKRSAFLKDPKKRYENRVRLAVFIARHVNELKKPEFEKFQNDVREIENIEFLINMVNLLYYGTELSANSEKLVGLNFAITSIWIPIYWAVKGNSFGTDNKMTEDEIIEATWYLCSKDMKYLQCTKNDIAPLLEMFGDHEEFQKVVEKDWSPSKVMDLRNARQQLIRNRINPETFEQIMLDQTGNLFYRMWNSTRKLIDQFDREFKNQSRKKALPITDAITKSVNELLQKEVSK